MEQATKNIFDFPSPLIDPKDKGEDFIMQYGKAMYHTFKRSGFKMFYNNRPGYREEILFAQGNQSVDQYKQRLDCWEDQDQSYLNLDWQILNLCSKFVNIVQGKLNKVDFNILITAIDALAIDQKKDYLAKVQAYKELQAWAQAKDIAISKDFVGVEQLPIEMENDELEIFMNMSLKHRWAMSMEKAINAVLNSNDFSHTKKEVIWDLIVLGVGVIKVTEKKDGSLEIEKCNPENIIVSNASNEKFKNVQHVGEVKTMTPEEYFARCGNIYTPEQKEDILKNHLKKFSQTNTNEPYNGGSIANNQIGMLEVLDFVFFSEDQMVHEKKKDRRGNPKVYRKKYNYPSKMSMEEYEETYEGEREVIKTSYDNLYKGLWLIGSEYLCDYGPVSNINRKDNLVDCFFPYILIAPNMQHGVTTSMVRQMIPVLNFIQLNWLKYNDAIAKAKPKGAGIDLDALESIALGKGGKNFTPKQAIDLWEKKGIVVFRGKNIAKDGANRKPIEEIENGMAADAGRFFENIVGGINLLRDITGLNEVTDASSPDPKLLKSVAEAAMAGTNNAVDHLYHGINQIYQDLCRQLSVAIVNGIKNGSTELEDSIGGATTRFFGDNSEITAHKYGIKIENKPSQDEWNGFYGELQIALQNQTIDASDAAFCREIDNLKEARQYLIVRERKKADRMAQAEQAKIEQAAQANQQAAQATIEMQKQATQIEIDGKIRLEQEKRATALAVEEQKRITILLQTQMQLEGKNQNKVIEGGMKSTHIEQKGEYDLAAQHIKNQQAKEKNFPKK